MYKAGITVENFINSIKAEADISVDIPEVAWYRWLNTVEQTSYTEVLKEYAEATIIISDALGVEGENDATNVIPLIGIETGDDGDYVTYDDIIRVYNEDGNELIRGGAVSATDFPEKEIYYTDYCGNLILSTPKPLAKIKVVYRLRPILKSESTKSKEVALPIEFLDMAAAKMRGEAYKLSNENGLAGVWLSDYNQQMENFKLWAASRNERYGV